MSSDQQAESGEEEPGAKWSGAQEPNFRAIGSWGPVKPDAQALGSQAPECRAARILQYIRAWMVFGPFWTVLGVI